MRLNRLLRGIGFVSLLPLLAWLVSLIVIGGEVRVAGDRVERIYGVPQVILREPVWIALIPLVFVLIALIGFVKNEIRLLWISGTGLLVLGVIPLFSLGMQLLIFGFVIVLTAYLLRRLGANSINS